MIIYRNISDNLKIVILVCIFTPSFYILLIFIHAKITLYSTTTTMYDLYTCFSGSKKTVQCSFTDEYICGYRNVGLTSAGWERVYGISSLSGNNNDNPFRFINNTCYIT